MATGALEFAGAPAEVDAAAGEGAAPGEEGCHRDAMARARSRPVPAAPSTRPSFISQKPSGCVGRVVRPLAAGVALVARAWLAAAARVRAVMTSRCSWLCNACAA